jgi:hypothetical protein
MKKTLIFLMLLMLLSTVSSAEEYPYIYKGIRPMGMGGAFVAVSNDANALFYNPAGLADIKTVRASIFPLELELGEKAYDLFNDASDVDFDDELETAEFLRENIGERAHLALNLFPYYSMPRFAFGLIGTVRTDLEVYDRQYPKVITNVINDLGVGAGYAHPFLEDTLLVGASAKYINRQSLIEEYTVIDITSDDLNEKIEDDLLDGSGVLIDLGVIYKLDKHGLADARVGVSANNLFGGDLGDARDVDDHIDIGFAIDREIWITKTTLAFDYVDLFSQLGDDDDLAKRIRLGAEFRFPKILSVRVGLYQGYFTSGLSLDAKYAQLDILTYAEEIGAFAGQRIDRRYSLRFVLGF